MNIPVCVSFVLIYMETPRRSVRFCLTLKRRDNMHGPLSRPAGVTFRLIKTDDSIFSQSLSKELMCVKYDPAFPRGGPLYNSQTDIYIRLVYM